MLIFTKDEGSEKYTPSIYTVYIPRTIYATTAVVVVVVVVVVGSAFGIGGSLCTTTSLTRVGIGRYYSQLRGNLRSRICRFPVSRGPLLHY